MIWRKHFMGPLREGEPQPAGGGQPPIENLPPTTPPAVDDPVTRLSADVARMGQTLDRVVEGLRNTPAPGTPPPSQSQPQQPPNAKAMEAEFWKNPLGMTQAIATAAVTQAMQQPQAGTDTLVDVARGKAREREPKIFDLLIAEIEAKVKGMPPQFHTSVSVWNNAFNMAVGENLDRVLAERAKGATPPAPGASPAGAPSGGPALPSPRAPQAPPEEKLDEETQSFIKRFGISEKRWRAGKKAYEEQGSGRPDEPSSWDAVITFDSEVAKRRRLEAAEKAKGGK